MKRTWLAPEPVLLEGGEPVFKIPVILLAPKFITVYGSSYTYAFAFAVWVLHLCFDAVQQE